jgi:hypothetical protein
MLGFVVWGALLALIIWTIWKLYVFPTWFSTLRHLPMPSGAHPILGHVPKLRTPRWRGEACREWMESMPNDGLIRVKDLFNGDAIVPTTPAMLKAILVDHSYDFVKHEGLTSFLEVAAGTGIFSAEGDEHKFQRKSQYSGQISPSITDLLRHESFVHSEANARSLPNILE